MSEYPQDEFDEMAATGPSGAHRAVRPRWRTYLPFVLVIVLAPLLAWGVVLLMQHNGDMPKQATTASQPQKQATKPATTEPKAKQKAQKQQAEKDKTPAEQQTSAEDKDKLIVKVLNVNAPSGSAGSAAKLVEELGFKQVTPGNAPRAVLPDSTVYYKSESDKAAAEEIAQKLGISRVEMSARIAGTDDIRVYLKNDYAPQR